MAINPRNESRSYTTARSRALVAVPLAVAALVSGCGNPINTNPEMNVALDWNKLPKKRVPLSYIMDHTNIRFDDAVIKPREGLDNTHDNSCAFPKSDVPIDPTDAVYSFDSKQDSPHSSSPDTWTGFRIADLPPEVITDRCKEDADGILWTVTYRLADGRPERV